MIIFKCRIVYESAMDPVFLDAVYKKDLYPEKDFHTLYFADIFRVLRVMGNEH